MHLAIRENRKTVTRRLDGLKEINEHPDKWKCTWELAGGRFCFQQNPSIVRDIRPRYKVGEVVYIKEAYKIGDYTYLKYANIIYQLDNATIKVGWDEWLTKNTKYGGSSCGDDDKWRSPMFLRECFARDFIQIIDVKPQRLQEITPEDCEREGIRWTCGYYCDANVGHVDHHHMINQYHALWDSINKNYPWALNPWLWRIEFKRVENHE